MPAATVTFAARFAGPPDTANGGYTAGRLATLASGMSTLASGMSTLASGMSTLASGMSTPISVTLLQPTPLEVPLGVERVGDETRLVGGAGPLASVVKGSLAHDPVEAVGAVEAERAQAAYRGLAVHPFPGCFVCGPERAVGDGLRLFPGLVAPGRTACVWRPDASLATADGDGWVAAEYVWAALDCPGGWTSEIDQRPLVLGRMTAEITEPPRVDDRVVVVGELLGTDGRKAFSATAAYDESGRLLGRAEQVWIAVDPAAFGPRKDSGD